MNNLHGSVRRWTISWLGAVTFSIGNVTVTTKLQEVTASAQEIVIVNRHPTQCKTKTSFYALVVPIKQTTYKVLMSCRCLMTHFVNVERSLASFPLVPVLMLSYANLTNCHLAETATFRSNSWIKQISTSHKTAPLIMSDYCSLWKVSSDSKQEWMAMN